MGYEAEDMIEDEMDNITEQDITQYKYPDDREIERVGVRGIYLNNYIRWDSRAQHEVMIQKFGYQTLSQTRTFDCYNDVDCHNYSDLHDQIKFLKHGYGKVVDHATREIRLRRMTRREGIQMLEKYLYLQPLKADLFLDWIGMTHSGFRYLIDQHRSKKVWGRNDQWEWELKQDIIEGLRNSGDEAFELPQIDRFTPFQSDREQDPSRKYILIGKGYNEGGEA
jgi:hypothetical protein